MAKGDNTNPAEYTIEDAQYDLKQMVKIVKSFASRFEVVEKRVDAMESVAQNADNGTEGDSFDAEDKKKALSVLAKQVFNPDENMLIQMTEIPNRMVMPVVIERTMNEFIKVHAFDPNSDMLLSDLFIKHYAIVMRALRRQLIQEAMGFSQIEMEKTAEEEARKIELEE